MSDALINGLAGAGGGIIAQIITYPLQTVATRQQTERDPRKKGRKIGTLEQIFQEGWERLYGGLLPSLVGTAASQGVYYYFYQIFRKKAELSAAEQRRKGIGNGTVGMLASLWVAALSGCINVLITTPIWVVVTRMQTHIKPPKNSKSDPSLPDDLEDTTVGATEPPPYGMSNAIQEVYDESGVSGFWGGLLPTLIMVSNPSIQFMLYESMLKKLKNGRSVAGKSRVTPLKVFFLGAVAKLGATVVTYPLLVLKSRLQAKQASAGDSRHHYKGMSDAILKMVRYEGVSGFYKGMSTKLFQSVLAAALLLATKEELVPVVRLFFDRKSRSNPTSSNPK